MEENNLWWLYKILFPILTVALGGYFFYKKWFSAILIPIIFLAAELIYYYKGWIYLVVFLAVTMIIFLGTVKQKQQTEG